jgi:beta-lactamase superfamily II metal-dependent hydrolase
LGVFHFLNVKNGDCSIIQHPSERVTMVDVYNAEKEEEDRTPFEKALREVFGSAGNFNQKEDAINPISYLRQFSITDLHRFILTHPDMDHMGGIKDLFEVFPPTNFWDTANTCEKDFEEGGPYDESDWKFYRSLRDRNPQSDPKRLVLYSGARAKYYNQDESGTSGGDGLYVLAPTRALIDDANDSGDYNDASYVILYRSEGGRILLAGDSHDKTWEHILENHEDDVRDVDLLIAPHHGRKSGRSYDFLNVVNPTLTFFGNASSDYLAYDAWSYRNLAVITNNQADCMVVDTNFKPMKLYITNKTFAAAINPSTWYSSLYKAYYVIDISR